MTNKQRDRLLIAIAKMLLEPDATLRNDYVNWIELSRAIKAAKAKD